MEVKKIISVFEQKVKDRKVNQVVEVGNGYIITAKKGNGQDFNDPTFLIDKALTKCRQISLLDYGIEKYSKGKILYDSFLQIG